MPSGTNKVKANMDPSVVESGQLAFNFQFFLKISFKLGINVINNRLKRFFFVDLVSIPNRIN